MEKTNVYAIQNKNNTKKSICDMYSKLMEQFDYFDGIINENDKVLIKPNLVAPFEKATTDLTLLEQVIISIKKRNAIPIVAESSGFEFSTEDTFKILGVDRICKKYKVKLLNLDKEEFIYVDSENPFVPKYKLPKLLFEVDKIINMPCLKGHSLTKVTFGIKNLFGLLHRETRRKIHSTNLDIGIACLRKLIPVDFVIVDGLWNLINAVYSETSYWGILIAGNNLEAVDLTCCSIYGIDYRNVAHISLCIQNTEYGFHKLTPINKMDNHIEERNEHFKKQNKLYKYFYSFDRIYSFLFRSSIIPKLHYWLALRPYIKKNKCNGCNKCIEVCPANAIKNKKIIHKKCMNIRCLKCMEVCPNHAILKKGLHK